MTRDVQVRVLYTLVMGLMDSAATIFYTFVLLFFFLYLFAVLGVEVLQFFRFLCLIVIFIIYFCDLLLRHVNIRIIHVLSIQMYSVNNARSLDFQEG